MRSFRRSESGFSLIEVLVALSLFSVISVGIYSVMFSTVDTGETTQDVVDISQEARAGFNRMVRDTREAQRLERITATSYEVKVDFNRDSLYENPNSQGDYEDLTFACVACNPGPGQVMLNGEVLLDGVYVIPSKPLFAYSSNLLEYDWDDNGTTSCLELDSAYLNGVVGVGNGINGCDDGEDQYITSIDFALRVKAGSRSSDFYAQAQLRNRR
jgi:prepilin-type N-terminal cleavage/methylation domain-containing protein